MTHLHCLIVFVNNRVVCGWSNLLSLISFNHTDWKISLLGPCQTLFKPANPVGTFSIMFGPLSISPHIPHNRVVPRSTRARKIFLFLQFSKLFYNKSTTVKRAIAARVLHDFCHLTTILIPAPTVP